MHKTGIVAKLLLPEVESKVVFGAKIKVIYDSYLDQGIKKSEICRRFKMSPSQVSRMFKGRVTDENMAIVAQEVGVELDELTAPDWDIITKLIKYNMKNDGNFMLLMMLLLISIIGIVMFMLTQKPSFGLVGVGCACFGLSNIRNIWRPLNLDAKAKRTLKLSKYAGALFVSVALISEIIISWQM